MIITLRRIDNHCGGDLQTISIAVPSFSWTVQKKNPEASLEVYIRVVPTTNITLVNVWIFLNLHACTTTVNRLII